jgi:hypothetical protein
MSMFLMMIELVIAAGLSPETLEYVETIDSLAAATDPSLATRTFLVTGPCIPGIGYETCELTVGETAITELVGNEAVPAERVEWMECRFTHAGFVVTSRYYLEACGEPVLCVSSWEGGDGEPPLFSDRFYFGDGETVACAYGDGEVVEPSEEDLLRGAERLAHAEALLHACGTLSIPAPPMYMERIEEVCGVD